MFISLEQVFLQGGSGVLVHPVWPAARAYFVSLELTEEPLPDYVQYSFEFWEDWNGYAGGLTEVDTESASIQKNTAAANSELSADTVVYSVRKGDTLWCIAKRYGVSLTVLIAANPQIKNPNLIYPGDRVNIP